MRVVATDLDGTLVGRDHSVSDRNRRALAACRAAGVEVLFVTGRPLRWMAPVVEATGIAGTAICANGAAVYDLATQELLDHHPVDTESVLPVVERLRAALGSIAVALETPAGAVAEHGYATSWDADRRMPRGDLTQLLVDHPTVLKVLVRGEGPSSDEMLAVARELLDGSLTATHSNAGGSLLELSAGGVSKARTLAGVIERLGLTAGDVVAFGDQPNDVEMLTWAGRGVAMGDGHPEALAVADEIAPPLSEDGVAQVIERLLSRG